MVYVDEAHAMVELNKLPRRTLYILERYHDRGESAKDIADSEHVSIRAIYQRLQRAERRLGCITAQRQTKRGRPRAPQTQN